MKHLRILILVVLIIWMCNPKTTSLKSSKRNSINNTEQKNCDEKSSTKLINMIQNANFIAGRPFLPESVSEALEKGLIYKPSKEVKDVIKVLSTSSAQFEKPGAFTNLFKIYSKDLVLKSKILNQKIDTSDFYILSNHTLDVNAKTLLIPNCYKKLILFNDIFAVFCHEIPRDLYHLYNVNFFAKNSKDYDSFKKGNPIDLDLEFNIDSNTLISNVNEFKNKMRYAAIAMYHLGLSSWVEDESLDDHHKFFLALMTSGEENFIIAHELAHIFRGHVGTEMPMFALSNNTDSLKTVKSYLYNWAQELEADYYGTLLFTEYLKSKSNGLTSSKLQKWSPCILMSNRELYDKIQSIKINGGEYWSSGEDVNGFSSDLQFLSDSPSTNEFHKLITKALSNLSKPSNSNHPPEAYRKEIVKYALFKKNY